MGMTFEEDAAAKKRRELKERLVGKQEKVQPQQEYYINEFGEIIRNENNQQQGNSSSNNDDDLTDTVRTLAQFVTVAEKKAHVWKLVKYITLIQKIMVLLVRDGIIMKVLREDLTMMRMKR